MRHEHVVRAENAQADGYTFPRVKFGDGGTESAFHVPLFEGNEPPFRYFAKIRLVERLYRAAVDDLRVNAGKFFRLHRPFHGARAAREDHRFFPL